VHCCDRVYMGGVEGSGEVLVRASRSNGSNAEQLVLSYRNMSLLQRYTFRGMHRRDLDLPLGCFASRGWVHGRTVARNNETVVAM
jgi:hypothetical protein